MKNIRFKAWNKVTKEMEEVLLICFVNKYVNVLPEYELEGGSQLEWMFSDIELLQSIGQNDRRERPIFEGDLIQDKNNMVLGYVINTSDGFMIQPVSKYSKGNVPEPRRVKPMEWSECLVFGNVNQHPERI